MDESLYEFVYSCGCEAEFATPRVSELNKMIEAEATKRTEKMVDERFIERKKEFQLEVLKQVQEEGIRKEGLKSSASSPLISETYTVDGIELNTSCFIPESIQIDPLYEEKQLIKNAYSLEWQEQNKKAGQRKFAALWNPIAVLIQNPKGIGSCENIIVAMKGEKTPLIFPHGDISYEEFRRQTP